MTIDEAIKELEAELQCDFRLYTPSFRKALGLGIEALKRLKKHRTEHIDITFRALPGETK